MVPKSGKYYGRPFSTGRGVTHGDMVSPALFNIIVDAGVKTTLKEICGPQEAQHGLVWSAEEQNIYFYEDGGHIAGQDQIWVQAVLATMVGMFERVGL